MRISAGGRRGKRNGRYRAKRAILSRKEAPMPARKTAAIPAKRQAGKATAKKAPAAKAAGKKSPAGKSAIAKVRSPKAGAAKSPLLEELLALLPELDEAGLAFLLEQARVHRYNMEVERLNAITDRAAADNATHAPAGKATGPGPLRIERSADGSTYHLVAGSDWKMFTAEEMAALVRITRSGETVEEVARRLRAWLARERKDVYLDLGLDGPSVGMARDIAALIAGTFPKRG
jgi:hypothetical protein